MDLQVAMYGAAPALVAMYVVDRVDAKRPEPRATLRKLALAGAVSVIPCAILEVVLMAKVSPHFSGWAGAFFNGFIVAAAVEELAKLLCLRLFVWNKPEFDERLDGIVYATRAGLGFAMVENVLYLVNCDSYGGYLAMYVARALLAVPGHAVFAAMTGYFATRKRFDGVGPGALGGYAIAVLLHGAYDAAVFGVPLVEKDPALTVALLSVPVLVVAGGLVAVRVLAKRALARDDAQFGPAEAAAAAAAEAAAAAAAAAAAVVAPPPPPGDAGEGM
jgi:RsiW-degrading membrane proteinase PrsW (M82 family)